MKKILPLLLLPAFLLSCSVNKEEGYAYSTDNLNIKSLGRNVFMHISYLTTNDFGKVDCNGMIYFNGDEAIVFDTPTDDIASAELIDWIQSRQGKKITSIIVTHFHDDCLGGLTQFHTNGTKSYASYKTIALAKNAHAKALPESGFDLTLELNVGDRTVYATYFGAGHTEDNIVGYIPGDEVLFGGCLIKSMNAGKGYLGDANVPEWSKTVAAIASRLPELKIVIPGHGNPGGKELLDYTIQLFQ